MVNRPMIIMISMIEVDEDETESTTAMAVTLKDWIEFSKTPDVRLPKNHIVTEVEPTKSILTDYKNAKVSIDRMMNKKNTKEFLFEQSEEVTAILSKLTEDEVDKIFDYFDALEQSKDVDFDTEHESIDDQSVIDPHDVNDWRNWSNDPNEYL
tara:strand:- start:681 stop:1139 length:459 start_codon:yes stop_codon:yes gene_type:complete